jgi:hypothetical protein
MLRSRTSPNILFRAFATVLLTPVTNMEHARLETGTLRDVNDDYYYGCSCRSCSHTARLSLSKLRSHLGDDFPLRTIRQRLTTPSRRRTTFRSAPSNARVRHTVPNNCEICGSGKVTVTFLRPHQKGGNLRELFEKEARSQSTPEPSWSFPVIPQRELQDLT